MPTHGYSGKPLYQKLGMKPGMACLSIGAPTDYDALLGDAEDVSITARKTLTKPAGPFVLVHLFASDRNALDTRLAPALGSVAEGGMLWISWPKKSSPLFKDVTEDTLREVVLPTGWVDVKVCAVSADWSGLKFMKRRKS